MAKRITVFTDGAAAPNPGPAGVGIVVLDESGKMLSQVSRNIGRATNNQAEYVAVVMALEEAARLNAEHVEVRSDSELLVRQIGGEYRVRNPVLKPLFEQVRRLMNGFASCHVVHIPREQNKAADALSRNALHRVTRSVSNLH